MRRSFASFVAASFGFAKLVGSEVYLVAISLLTSLEVHLISQTRFFGFEKSFIYF
jgi:hypothetical protein